MTLDVASGFVHAHPDPLTDERRAPRWERATRGRHRLRPLSERYRGLGRRTQMWVDIAVHEAVPLVVGFLVYLPLAFTAPIVLEIVFWIVFVSMAVTSFLIAMECARAHRFPEPPRRTAVPDKELPRLATVVAAYLPNEQETLMESLRAHLSLDYPADRHLLVLAYNTPEPLPIESQLQALAEYDARVVVLRVEGSTSKVENVNAALELLGDRVDVIGIFDADHHPHPTAPRRVAQWLSDAAGDKRFDVVQGQCAVRNVDESSVTRTIAAEFATLYAVAHPGRTVVHDFGIFGGSNGWWRAEVITELGLDPAMLTEDIDVSARALADGRRLATDPRILSYELAPVDVVGVVAPADALVAGLARGQPAPLGRAAAQPAAVVRPASRCRHALRLADHAPLDRHPDGAADPGDAAVAVHRGVPPVPDLLPRHRARRPRHPVAPGGRGAPPGAARTARAALAVRPLRAGLDARLRRVQGRHHPSSDHT